MLKNEKKNPENTTYERFYIQNIRILTSVSKIEKYINNSPVLYYFATLVN